MSDTGFFITYHSRDEAAAQQIKQFLEAQGYKVCRDRDSLSSGLPWPEALTKTLTNARAVVVLIGPHGLDWWQKWVIAWTASCPAPREPAETSRPVIPVLLPGADLAPAFLGDYAWIDLRQNPTDLTALAKLAAAASGEAPRRAIAVIVDWCPYPGLRSFREEDAAFFFGREALTTRLLKLVQTRNLVTVVGPAGSGKSSLVQAGLLPLLRRASRAGQDSHKTWDMVTFTPGDRPFQRLVTALCSLGPPDLQERVPLRETRTLGHQLANGAVALPEVIEQVLARTGGAGRSLLIVDQFEELLTLAPAASRQPFIEMLLQASTHPSISLLLILQANFYGQVTSLGQPIADHLAEGLVNVGPFSRQELEWAMVKPTRPVTLAFEPGLIERILDDLTEDPMPLPRLQFTLAELWRYHQGGLLRHAVYEEIGQVGGAMAHRAEQVFAALTPTQQALTRRIFTRLGQVTPQGQVTCRQASLMELSPRLLQEGVTEVRQVVRMWVEAQLLALRQDEATDREMVEVIHEALNHNWPRWQRWLNSEREFLLWRQRLRLALAHWEESDQPDPAILLRGAALVEAEQWLAQQPETIATDEWSYIWQSLAHRNWERDRRWLLGIAISLVVISLMAVLAWRQSETIADLRQERDVSMTVQAETNEQLRAAGVAQATTVAQLQRAEQQGQQVLAQQLAAQAPQLLDSKLEQGLLLAIEAFQRSPALVEQAVAPTLRRGLALLPYPVAQMEHQTKVATVIFSPDGRWLATASHDGVPRIWEAATGREVAKLSHQKHGLTSALNLEARHKLARQITTTDERPISIMAFSPDGQWLVTGSWGGMIRVWDVATGQLISQLSQDGQAITAVAFSPDGRWLAVGSWDGAIQMWSLTAASTERPALAPAFASEKRIELNRPVTWLAHRDVILALAFSPDSRRLATASADNTVRLWHVLNMYTGEMMAHREMARLVHGNRVATVTFSPNGRWLVTGSADHTARIWEIRTRREVARLPHRTEVKIAAFSPDGLWLVTVGKDNKARIWLASPGAVEAVARERKGIEIVHAGYISALAFSPDSRWLATASADSTARVWQIATGQQVAQMSHTHQVNSVVFSPDSQWLATASSDQTARVWQAVATQEIAQLDQQGWVLGVTLSPDGRWLATKGRQVVQVWATATHQLVAHMEHERWVSQVAFSADGRWLATGSRDKVVRVWEVTTGQEVAQLAHPGPVHMVTFSPAGPWLSTASNDQMVRIWDMAAIIDAGAAADQKVTQLAHAGWVKAIAFSPDGYWLATASSDGTARVWEVATGEEITRLDHAGAVFDLAFSPNGRWLATASVDHTVRIWLAGTVREIARLTHPAGVEAVMFSPDSRLLAAKSGDTIWLWNVETEEELTRLPHHIGLGMMAFSPDGKWLATTTGNPPGRGMARLWEVATGQEVSKMGQEYWVSSVVFSPDSRWLVTAGGDPLTRVWLLQPQDLITETCARLTRNLTRAEWQHYLGDVSYRPTCPNLPVPQE